MDATFFVDAKVLAEALPSHKDTFESQTTPEPDSA